MKNAKRIDIQQQVTDRIIARLESGDVAPWKCPWTKTGETPIPYNWLTKQKYSGINILILWFHAMDMGYQRNAWLTYKQAEQLGGQVRKGEKSVACVFYKPQEVRKKDSTADDDEDKKFYLCRKPFAVFNVDQVDGLSDLPDLPAQPVYSDEDAVIAINHYAEAYCANEGVQIRHGGDRAFYSPSLDIIKLPTTFHSGSDYAATLAHELIHSTGHHKRLNRFEMGASSTKDFDASYAQEELVAEQGSALILAELGIDGQFEQNVSYIASWLKALKGDKNFIFKAAAAASKAHSFFMNGGFVVQDGTEEVA